MTDNSWIETDRSSHGSQKAMKMKVYITVALLLVGAVGTFALHGLGSNATMYQSEGVILDFGGYRTVWTDIDYNDTADPVEMLNEACQSHYHNLPVFTDGVLTSVTADDGTYANDDKHSWGLWYVERGEYDFTRADSYSITASDYTVVCWAYTVPGGEPSVAVDATATSIYGYSQPTSMASMSPVCTEIVGSMNAVSLLKGTDSFSDYPSSVKDRRDKGLIQEVGTYTNPSYEAVLSIHPDMVICDSSQKSHVDLAGKLRSSDINSVVIYNGKDLETTLDNIFLVGTAMNYNMLAEEVISQISHALDVLFQQVQGHGGASVIVALSPETSPYIAGSGNFMDDIIVSLGNENKGAGCGVGWPNPNAEEYIQNLNPEYAIIISDMYKADEYQQMLDSMSQEWKNTDAFKEGKVYLFTEDFGTMAARSGPRIAQLTEMMARILDPGAFTDGIAVPNAIGNDYDQYLDLTKNLGFDD